MKRAIAMAMLALQSYLRANAGSSTRGRRITTFVAMEKGHEKDTEDR